MVIDEKKGPIVLLVVLMVALVLRVGFLLIGWINPDEGAHLMDGRLILDGYTPILDYESRQPFYVFMIALFLKLFGVSYLVGRMMPLVFSMGTGVLLYIIGRKLFDSTVGLLACTIFLFTPLTIAFSVVVKTEPLTIFLVCLSLTFLLLALDEDIERIGWMILSGICAALAYYVRASALLLPLIIVAVIFIRRDVGFKGKITQLSLFFLGYLCLCVLMGIAFSRSMNLSSLLSSQINPFDTVVYRILHILDQLPEEAVVANSTGFRILNQDLAMTMYTWRQAVFFCLFIVVAAVASVVSYVIHRIKQGDKTNEFEYGFLVIWSCLILFPYVYQSAFRGFFPQYFVEALPPLVLLAAVLLKNKFPLEGRDPVKVCAAVLAGYYVLFGVQKVLWRLHPGTGISLCAASALVALLYARMPVRSRIYTAFVSLATVAVVFFGLSALGVDNLFALVFALVVLSVVLSGLKRFLGKGTGGRIADPVLFVLIMAYLLSAVISGYRIGPQYVGAWPQSSVRRVVDLLKREGRPSDDILCGATIWTFESGFAPYWNVSHPTQFLLKSYENFEEEFRRGRPRFIIMDGYTQKKLARFWTFIEEELVHYDHIATVPSPIFPIEIYKLSPTLSYTPRSYKENRPL